MRVLVAGCGDVGLRLARRLAADGHAVLAIRRGALPPLAGVECRAADLLALAPGALADWGAEAAVCLAGPQARSPEAYRRCYGDLPLAVAAAAGSVRRFIVVASTAIFGGDDGGWVDEDSPAPPADWRGEALLAAEARLRAAIAAPVLACPSGLYGPGREYALRRARAGDAGERRWSNRIHVEDAAAALAHLLALPEVAPRYCLNDDTPVPEDEFLDDLRALLGLPRRGVDATRPVRGRRISNRRLRASGFECRWRDHRAGYADLLQAPPVLRV